MFENVLYQNATEQLIQAIENNTLPQSLLFFGPSSSAKLTTALELARVLSCKAKKQGKWLCDCKSCAQHKLLVHQNLLLLGPRDTSLEIAASKASFIEAMQKNAEYKEATRFLFLRSIRKLLLRFHPVLMQDDDQASKVASYIEPIQEILEEIEKADEIALEVIEKNADKLIDLTLKLEDQFANDTIPVLHIRNLSYWARLTSADGKKIVIIENADRMLDASKNALLKILEEPPKNLSFILLTSQKTALLPTILSRLRPYSFAERSESEQKEVIERVFHSEAVHIESFLLQYLPVPTKTINTNAKLFYNSIQDNTDCEIEQLVKDLGGFKSRLVISLFFNQLFLLQREMIRATENDKKALVLEITHKNLSLMKAAYENIRFLHQNPQSAFEALANGLKKNTFLTHAGKELFR